jgi:hypothetical protein
MWRRMTLVRIHISEERIVTINRMKEWTSYEQRQQQLVIIGSVSSQCVSIASAVHC